MVRYNCNKRLVHIWICWYRLHCSSQTLFELSLVTWGSVHDSVSRGLCFFESHSVFNFSFTLLESLFRERPFNVKKWRRVFHYRSFRNAHLCGTSWGRSELERKRISCTHFPKILCLMRKKYSLKKTSVWRGGCGSPNCWETKLKRKRKREKEEERKRS